MPRRGVVTDTTVLGCDLVRWVRATVVSSADLPRGGPAHIPVWGLSQMSHEHCPSRAQPLMGTLLWLPGPLLFPPPCCLNLPCLPSATSLPNHPLQASPTAPLHPVPPSLLLSLPLAHLAPHLWAVQLWAAPTPSLLDRHSEKRDIDPIGHGTAESS